MKDSASTRNSGGPYGLTSAMPAGPRLFPELLPHNVACGCRRACDVLSREAVSVGCRGCWMCSGEGNRGGGGANYLGHSFQICGPLKSENGGDTNAYIRGGQG